MRVSHAGRPHGFGYLSIVLAGLLAGCGGNDGGGSASSTEVKAGTRRKEMADFMKNQSPNALPKGVPRNHP
jgi:hypothetical protein